LQRYHDDLDHDLYDDNNDYYHDHNHHNHHNDDYDDYDDYDHHNHDGLSMSLHRMRLC
jgi:hypothetical protein